MDIVLDSNIFRSDISLRSRDFDILLDYLSKTQSSVIIPQIILDEIKGLYSRALNERIAEIQKHANNFNLLMSDSNKKLKLPPINTEEETEVYIKHVKKKLKIYRHNLLPYNNEFLPVISNRAINRQKPSGDKGQGFRDTLIWLTMIEYCKKCHEKQITFISNNTEDFANADKSSLHSDLKKECDDAKIKINYFKSLREFIDNHSTTIDFINTEWIYDNLDDQLIQDYVLDYLNSDEVRNIVSIFKNEFGTEYSSYKAKRFDIEGDENFTVYEMLDNRLIINIYIDGYVEFEVEVETYQSRDDEYMYYTTTVDRYEKITANFTITLVDKKIQEIEITDVD